MKRTTLVGVLMCLSIFAAGCAAPGGDKAKVYHVTIKVTPGASPCATATPDELPVPLGGGTILFELDTSSSRYHFGPGKGITFKGNPPVFEHLPGQSNRGLVAYHDRYTDASGKGRFPYSIEVEPDGGGTPCRVDPLVVNG